MKTSSKKAKSKRLEKLVRDRIVEAFNLDEEDARITIGSETGADIKLSPRAKRYCPMQFECKAQEKFLTLYSIMEQAKRHGELVPVTIIKMNHREPLAILDLDHFFTLVATKALTKGE